MIEYIYSNFYSNYSVFIEIIQNYSIFIIYKLFNFYRIKNIQFHTNWKMYLFIYLLEFLMKIIRFLLNNFYYSNDSNFYHSKMIPF